MLFGVFEIVVMKHFSRNFEKNTDGIKAYGFYC